MFTSVPFINFILTKLALTQISTAYLEFEVRNTPYLIHLVYEDFQQSSRRTGVLEASNQLLCKYFDIILLN